MSSLSEDLTLLRQEIDKIDQEIIDLLKRRINIVEQVGKHKSKHSKTSSFIRSGREAEMLRDLTKKMENKFPPAAIATIWRMIISTSLNLEQGMSAASYVNEEDETCYWLAREYYGSFIPISKEYNADDVVHKVASSEVAVGILPLLEQSNGIPWWLRPSKETNDLYVFARIPFIEQPHHNDVPVLAIANVFPEKTDDDKTLFAINSDENNFASIINKIEKYFPGKTEILTKYKKLDYLVEVDCYISHDNSRLNELRNELGKNQSIRYMGAYATPIKA